MVSVAGPNCNPGMLKPVVAQGALRQDGHAETSGQDHCSARRFACQANHLGMLEAVGRIFAAQGASQKDQANPPGHAETSGQDLRSARRFIADQANHLGMLEAVGRIFAAQGASQKDQANHLGMPKPAVRIFAAQGAF